MNDSTDLNFLPRFLTSRATPTSLNFRYHDLGYTSLESTRWSLRSSSERTQPFRFPHDLGHLVLGALDVCRQRMSPTQHARGGK
jgi:hypothetical protein